MSPSERSDASHPRSRGATGPRHGPMNRRQDGKSSSSQFAVSPGARNRFLEGVAPELVGLAEQDGIGHVSWQSASLEILSKKDKNQWGQRMKLARERFGLEILTSPGGIDNGCRSEPAVSEVGAMESQGGVAGIGTERRAMRGERGSYFRDGSTQSF